MFCRASLAVLAAVLLAIVPQTAAANTVTIAHAPGFVPATHALVDASVVIAETTFPDSPCRGRTTISVNAVMPDPKPEAAGYAIPDDCSVFVAPTLEADMLCTVLVHEYGHTAGFGHTDDPASIMFAGELAAYPPCAAWKHAQDLRRQVPPRQAAQVLVTRLGRGWRVRCFAPEPNNAFDTRWETPCLARRGRTERDWRVFVGRSGPFARPGLSS